jgi:hypothetical protein
LSGIVLDAGALIALERNDRGLWAALKLAARSGEDVFVPSTALAQVWRGTKPQALLASALQHCTLAPFDGLARRVGELCGKTGTSDVCDAHVALIAALRGDAVYTTDPRDIRLLVAACGKRRPTVIGC